MDTLPCLWHLALHALTVSHLAVYAVHNGMRLKTSDGSLPDWFQSFPALPLLDALPCAFLPAGAVLYECRRERWLFTYDEATGRMTMTDISPTNDWLTPPPITLPALPDDEYRSGARWKLWAAY